ncbi:hypothetical protein [Homoserinimonas sp. OAct 916]|uniref:hypothetical protein n=1 Tax=Homoserinimonas sp. OAct 916 TaxID=2211450 RepID=UPI001300464D|nr:hypothetical protein [Homoserinimonas sp. OAct 916]
MTYIRRAVLASIVVAVTVFGVTACSPAPSDDSWVLSPIRYDNRANGDPGPREMIDTPYTMTLIGDTAGGFWGISLGSYLHIDEAGTAVSRFNLADDDPHGSVAAVTPTTLVMASGVPGLSNSGSILLIDTESMSWEEVHRDSRQLGDIATTGGTAYFVAFDWAEETFTVDTVALEPGAEPVTLSPVFTRTWPVALDVDPSGSIYLATENERIVLAADGRIESRHPVASATPAVSVNQAGDVAWSGQDSPSPTGPTHVAGGSDEARTIIDRHIDCVSDDPRLKPVSVGGRPTLEHPDRLTLMIAEDTITLPFLCAAAGFTWINDRELVVSVGNETGAPLVRVTPPALPQEPEPSR